MIILASISMVLLPMISDRVAMEIVGSLLLFVR